MHYYKFNIADWNLGTSHLSLTEEAIYFRLINHYYDTESPIPLETHSVFRRLRMGSDVDTATGILEEFFTKTDNGWIHERCEKILKEYRKTANKNKKNGANGGRPKKDAACSETQEKPSGFSVGTQSEPKHNPNQEPLTKNHKPITNNQDKDKNTSVDTAVSTKKNKKIFDYSSWPEIPDEQIMSDWHEMRKRLKANVSQTVIKTFGKELNTAVKHGFTVDQCLSECVTRNWRGFKFEWLLNAGVSGYAKPNRKEYLDQNDTSWADSIEDSANFRYSPGGGQGLDQLDLPPIEGDFSRVGECGEGQGERGGDAPPVDPSSSGGGH